MSTVLQILTKVKSGALSLRDAEEQINQLFEKPVSIPKFSINETVKIIDNQLGHDFLIGDEVVLKENPCEYTWLAVGDRGYWAINEIEFERI